VKQDLDWIRTSVSRIQKIWISVPVVLSLMIFLSNWFYGVWVGETVNVPTSLTFTMAIFVAMTTFNMVYTTFINGVGIIRLQLITGSVSMIVNIPLSIVFAKFLHWGPTGVIAATCVCLLLGVVLRPIQYWMIVNGKHKGVWGA
jgi:O-antigen/teichoic acid export membrane protein